MRTAHGPVDGEGLPKAQTVSVSTLTYESDSVVRAGV